MNYIGEKIKELRRKDDMTQEKLADFLCVTYQTVSKWETGVTSPDLSLIVPLARLFKVTTDELFNFNESIEDIKRAKLKQRYMDTFKTGDTVMRLIVCEEAVKAYPGDMKWLNQYAWAIWCNAFSISDDTAFNTERDKVIALFKRVIENCENDEIKSNAIIGIVQCLNGKGDHAEAKKYAELYPDTKVSADEKKDLLIDCMTGDERIKKQQQRLLTKAENLIQSIIGEMSAEARIAAEKVINALIPDGNYLTFHHELYMIDLAEARSAVCSGDLDKAMLAIQKAREHAIAYDNIKGEYAFTAPLFDHIKYNTQDWYITGTTSTFEDFRALFDLPAYSPLKSHKDYEKLFK
ncbi:MAG: helix-turn-helix transcriptional regulator [Eubacteriales bacterium]|nr:helix-turn-helix transcriptional regulator [Eubacteriales bacterium]